MKWKTTVVLLLAVVGLGAYVSLYDLRQPTPKQRERRSKIVVSLPRESVNQLELELPDVTITLTYDGTVWRRSPDGARAYEEQINGILRHTNRLRASRVLTGSDDHPLTPSDFGLDPPVGRITLRTEEGSTTLLVGDTVPTRTSRYLQVAGRPELFIVRPALFDDANQPADTFRDPLLMRFNTWSASGLTIADSETTFSLTRTDNRWRLTEPITDVADRTEVTNLLRALEGIHTVKVVDDAPTADARTASGVDAPTLTVTLLLDGDPPANETTGDVEARPLRSIVLGFGAALPEDALSVYAVRSDEPTLYAVAKTDLASLRVDPDGLRSRACFEFFTNLVHKVELVWDDTDWTVERVDGRWQEAGSNEPIEVTVAETLLRTLADLRLSAFLEEHPSDLSQYGLSPAEGTISVWTTDRDEPQRLLIGSTIESTENRYGRIEGRDPVVRLPARVTELFPSAFE